MTHKLFGTDGIRGLANSFPMTPDIAMKVGMAAGRVFTRGEHRHRVVIGKDTRLSGYMVDLRWSRDSPRWVWTFSCSARCPHLRSQC